MNEEIQTKLVKKPMKVSRLTIDDKIFDKLMHDDKFYNFVLNEGEKSGFSIKTSFPKYDQWKDENGALHISLALAGYSKDKIDVNVTDRFLTIKTKQEGNNTNAITGQIVRGIARRNFRFSLYISEEFDTLKCQAKMALGLLEILIPPNTTQENITIEIGE